MKGTPSVKGFFLLKKKELASDKQIYGSLIDVFQNIKFFFDHYWVVVNYFS
jgi:hypothetical protein